MGHLSENNEFLRKRTYTLSGVRRKLALLVEENYFRLNINFRSEPLYRSEHGGNASDEDSFSAKGV